MTTIRQRVERQRVSAGRTAIMPVNPVRVTKPLLRVVESRMSAIEYIVENARPGEVVQIDDGDYYNEYLWSRYGDLKSASGDNKGRNPGSLACRPSLLAL